MPATRCMSLLLLCLIACSSSSSPPNSGPVRSASGKVEVQTPLPGAQVHPPLTITGKAAVFENRVHFRLRMHGRTVTEGVVLAQASREAGSEPGQLLPFEGSLSWPGGSVGAAELEVFAVRAKDGAPDHVVAIPIHLR